MGLTALSDFREADTRPSLRSDNTVAGTASPAAIGSKTGSRLVKPLMLFKINGINQKSALNLW